MRRLKGIEDVRPFQGGVLSIGNFDGVHRGHQEILSRLRGHAQRLSVPSVVMTFEPHPTALLCPERQPPRLTTAARKAELIGELGIDAVLEYPTDWKLLKLTPREFFDQIVLNQFDARGLVEGPNFYFGRDRAGDGAVLREYCESADRFLEIVSPALDGENVVSSSLIREAIVAGDVQRASELLGRNYDVTGTVTSGAQRGRTLGFPTANVDGIETLLPADGVYAALCNLPDRTYRAALSIGPNPTFSDGQRKVEAHLLEFSGDLYGLEIQIQIVRKIRNLRQFNSADELQVQIREDVAKIEESLQVCR